MLYEHVLQQYDIILALSYLYSQMKSWRLLPTKRYSSILLYYCTTLDENENIAGI